MLKRKVCLLIFALVMVIFCNSAYAADDAYSFDITYTGEIVEKVDKNATVILQATDGTVYSNVRIKVDFISGPAKPTIIAYDTAGIGYNIMEFGYWGPETGFAVGGTFKNETPVVATYPEAGTYVVQLTLIDINNNNAVITAKQFTQTVAAATTSGNNNVGNTNNIVDNNNTIDNNNTVGNVANNGIEEIPQTGTSIWVYLSVALIAMAIVYVFSVIKKNRE